MTETLEQVELKLESARDQAAKLWTDLRLVEKQTAPAIDRLNQSRRDWAKAQQEVELLETVVSYLQKQTQP